MVDLLRFSLLVLNCFVFYLLNRLFILVCFHERQSAANLTSALVNRIQSPLCFIVFTYSIPEQT